MESYKTISYIDKNNIERTKEMPSNQKTLDMISEIFQSNMVSGVLDMFRTQVQNDAMVDEAEKFIKNKLNPKVDDVE